MGKRHRQREKLTAPSTVYPDGDGAALELRGALSPATRARYADTVAGGLHREDARQRAIELLFEHLVVSWTIAGVATTKQKELVLRYRMATAGERRFVLATLRTHLADHFPEMEAP